MNLQATKDIITGLAREVGAMQRRHLGRRDLVTDRKSSSIDLVTEIDQKSDQMIVSFLAEHFPEHGILAEESGASGGDSEYRWVIDPLDGTTNYAQGLPIFAVSIALQKNGETVLGVVYEPMTDEMFTAIKGKGSFLNGERLRVGDKTELTECVLATGFPYDIRTHWMNNIDYFDSLVLKVRAIRRMGAAAYDLASVGAGRFDGFWELNLAPWDAAAAELVVTEAGGLIVPFRSDRRISIIAGNAAICSQIAEVLKEVDRKRGCEEP